MRAIMISIKPEWVAKILNGKKTIEIRKSIPKCELPIDVYIYCTKGKENEQMFTIGELEKPNCILNGKVVAKFTLNKVEEIMAKSMSETINEKEILEKSCLSHYELHNYLDIIDFEKGNHRPLLGYAWQIDDLVIFQRARELKEFFVYSHSVDGVGIDGKDKTFEILKPLNKAPQSWCYVEV